MMAQQTININVKDIYDELCGNCKKKLRDLIKEKLTDQMIEQMLSEGGK